MSGVLAFTILVSIALAADVPTYAAPREGTPCAPNCLLDPLSAACHQCCTTVHHEIDWACGTSGAALCCTDWKAECWDFNSTDNFYHACGQCTAASFTEGAEQTLEAESMNGAVATWTFNCVFTPSCDKTPGDVFPLGTTAVTCTCSLETVVHLIHVVDTTAPTLTVPANIVEEATSTAGAIVTYTVAFTDATGTLNQLAGLPSGSIFPIGVTTNTFKVEDLAVPANVVTRSFTVTVKDTTAPVFTPTNVVVEASGPTGAVVTYMITLSDAVTPSAILQSLMTCASDPSDPAYHSGGTFPVGSYTISCSTSDLANNVVMGSFTVTVQDTTSPIITANDVTVEAVDANGAVAQFDVTVGDAVTSTADLIAGLTCTSPSGRTSGSVFPLGSETITCTVQDASGNTASTTFLVVVADTTPPVITAADVVVEAVDANGSTASFTVTATDAVTPAATLNSGVVCTNADGYSSGDLFPLGTFTFTCAVLDEAGNEATQSFDVIVQDSTPPTISVTDMTVYTGSVDGIDVTFTVTAEDAVSGATTVTCASADGLTSGSTFPLGDTIVTCDSTDDYGNAAQEQFTITVTQIILAAARVPQLVEYDVSATDDVSDTVTLTCTTSPEPNLSSGSLFPIGVTTVTCAAQDEFGNEATASFNITIPLYCPWPFNDQGECSDACAHFGCGYTNLNINCTVVEDDRRICSCPTGTSINGTDMTQDELLSLEIFSGCVGGNAPNFTEVLQAINANPEPLESLFDGHDVTFVGINTVEGVLTITISPPFNNATLDDRLSRLLGVPVTSESYIVLGSTFYDITLDSDPSASASLEWLFAFMLTLLGFLIRY